MSHDCPNIFFFWGGGEGWLFMCFSSPQGMKKKKKKLIVHTHINKSLAPTPSPRTILHICWCLCVFLSLNLMPHKKADELDNVPHHLSAWFAQFNFRWWVHLRKKCALTKAASISVRWQSENNRPKAFWIHFSTLPPTWIFSPICSSSTLKRHLQPKAAFDTLRIKPKTMSCWDSTAQYKHFRCKSRGGNQEMTTAPELWDLKTQLAPNMWCVTHVCGRVSWRITFSGVLSARNAGETALPD